MPKAVRRQAYPPPLPSNQPQPPGTLVTGKTPSGVFGFPSHRYHLFEVLHSRRQKEWTNSGYRTTVRCVVDREEMEVDGEFASMEASYDEQVDFIRWAEDWSGQLLTAAEEVNKWPQGTP